MQTAKELEDNDLTRKVLECFVCNDEAPVYTSMGQNSKSRLTEGNIHVALLGSSAAKWTEIEVLDLFRQCFRTDVTGLRTNKGNYEHTL